MIRRLAASLGRSRIRGLAALIVLAWINPVAQAGIAAPAMPAGVAHCAHGSEPAHPAPCPDMRFDGCLVVRDLHADTSRAPEVRGDVVPLPVQALPTVTDGARLIAARHSTDGIVGPPLRIRYCKLRN
jgi:hypothetical protein